MPQSELDNKTQKQLTDEWITWTETEQGHKYKSYPTTKKVKVADRYAKMILEFYDYMKQEYSEAKYLFTSGKTVFGETYIINPDEHLSGSQLLRILKPIAPKAWLHLFRELKAKEISEALGSTLGSVATVQSYLDLERMETAMGYTKRFAIQEATAEI